MRYAAPARRAAPEFLLRFSDELRALDDPRDIIRASQRLLGEELKANRVGYGEVDASERYFTTEDNWTDGILAPWHARPHKLRPDVHDNLKAGVPLLIEDVSPTRGRPTPRSSRL